MLVYVDEVASATFSFTGTVGSTHILISESSNFPSFCVGFIVLVLVWCWFCVDF